jgi:hypothetical protein
MRVLQTVRLSNCTLRTGSGGGTGPSLTSGALLARDGSRSLYVGAEVPHIGNRKTAQATVIEPVTVDAATCHNAWRSSSE